MLTDASASEINAPKECALVGMALSAHEKVAVLVVTVAPASGHAPSYRQIDAFWSLGPCADTVQVPLFWDSTLDDSMVHFVDVKKGSAEWRHVQQRSNGALQDVRS